MKKILIWGTGKICREFCMHLLPSVRIVGFVETVHRKEHFNSYPVFQVSDINKQDFDILIVAIRYPDAGIEDLIQEQNIDRHTVIFLYPQDLIKYKEYMLKAGLLEDIINQAYFTFFLQEQLKSVLFDYEFLNMFYSKMDSYGKAYEWLQIGKEKFLQKINLPYVEQYLKYDYEIQKDVECNMYYVKECEECIYFPEVLSRKMVISRYRDCCIDAHNQSPLCVDINGKSMVYVEIGIQEGITLLRNINKIDYAYLVCQDTKWIPPLLKTFEKYLDKICIVGKVEAIPDRQIDIVYINTAHKAESFVSFFLENKDVGCYEVAVYYFPEMARNIKKMFEDYSYRCLDKWEVYYPYSLRHMEDLIPRKGLLVARRRIP